MATAADSDTALLTEHFGYPPVSLLDDIINSINILAERALNSVEQGLLNAPPEAIGFGKKRHPAKSSSSQPDQQQDLEEAARHEIENGTHQLETLLCASIDRNFDKFELYVLRNILCVRPEDRDYIRLSHYEGLNFDAATAPGAPTLESVTRLRRRLQASQKLNCMLHAEKARNEALLGELRALVGRTGSGASGGGAGMPGAQSDGTVAAAVKDEEGQEASPFAFLHNKGSLTGGDAHTPLTTTTAFSLSQMQALRALSTSLQNVMPDLKSGADERASEGRRSWRKERVEYVESAARKHLETMRGLELGTNGEVRDGEWQGEGRKFVKGEVEGLENIVSTLGQDSGATEEGDGAA